MSEDQDDFDHDPSEGEKDNWVIVIAARGKGRMAALRAILGAVKQAIKGLLPTNPAVQYEQFDPGGGGGPYETAFKNVQIYIEPVPAKTDD